MVIPKNAILIFSKAPETGKVKTRMKPLLTDAQCVELHLALLRDTIAKTPSTSADVFLYLSGAVPLPFDPGIPIRQQQGADLGERLHNAFSEQLADHGRVLIVGTDSPTFSPAVYEDAFSMLKDRELVLGPAEDGGYYLVGLSTPAPEIFQGIDWGSNRVFQQTLMAASNRSFALLPLCYDIDTPPDLQRLESELNESAHWPHTAAWLREHITRNSS